MRTPNTVENRLSYDKDFLPAWSRVADRGHSDIRAVGAQVPPRVFVARLSYYDIDTSMSEVYKHSRCLVP